MLQGKKHILLVAYTFPPYPGIGGRRWAKFAKYLTLNGYVVHVICAKNPFNEVSLWTDDIIYNKDIIIYNLPSLYPIVLDSKPNNYWEKFLYRLSLCFYRTFNKGNPYDKAHFWKLCLPKLAESLINTHDIKNVVATGPPFRLLYYMSILKQRLNNFKLLVDFRDPWTESRNYGLEFLSQNRRSVELKMEEFVCTNADVIFSPNSNILRYLTEKHQTNHSKFKLLSHGYDEDDYAHLTDVPKESGNVNFIFFGTLYQGSVSLINFFLNNLFAFASQSEFTDLTINLNVYSESDCSVFFKRNKPKNVNIKIFKPIAPKKLFQVINSCDAVVLFYTDSFKDYLSTKFYELIGLNKTMLYNGPEGEISRFLQTHSLGYSLNSTNIYDVLKAVFKKESKSKVYGNLEDYTFKALTHSLMECFK